MSVRTDISFDGKRPAGAREIIVRPLRVRQRARRGAELVTQRGAPVYTIPYSESRPSSLSFFHFFFFCCIYSYFPDRSRRVRYEHYADTLQPKIIIIIDIVIIIIRFVHRQPITVRTEVFRLRIITY